MGSIYRHGKTGSMKKTIKFVSNTGSSFENVFAVVKNETYVSDSNGKIELKADDPNAVVTLSFPGLFSVSKPISEIGNKIIIGGNQKQCAKNISTSGNSNNIKFEELEPENNTQKFTNKSNQANLILLGIVSLGLLAGLSSSDSETNKGLSQPVKITL